MSSFVTNLKSFTVHPQSDYIDHDSSFKAKISDTLKASVLYIGLAILICIPVFGVIKVVQLFYGTDLLKLRLANMKTVTKGPNRLLIVALLGPLVEETMCRLWLSFKKIYVIISVLVIAVVIAIELNGGSIYNFSFQRAYLLYLFEGVTLAAGLLVLIKVTTDKEFLLKHFRIIYYSSCIGFGLLHIMNFAPFKWNIIWAYPLLTLPQIALGFILGYIRIKNGFIWGVVLHCIINLGLLLVQR